MDTRKYLGVKIKRRFDYPGLGKSGGATHPGCRAGQAQGSARRDETSQGPAQRRVGPPGGRLDRPTAGRVTNAAGYLIDGLARSSLRAGWAHYCGVPKSGQTVTTVGKFGRGARKTEGQRVSLGSQGSDRDDPEGPSPPPPPVTRGYSLSLEPGLLTEGPGLVNIPTGPTRL